ncbi:MAG: hypothetical protein QXU98_14740 [Candidatus Parvarchaeota archaeon]
MHRGLTSAPGNSPVTVAGHNLPFAVTLGPPLFSITFNESDLSMGTIWNAALGSFTENSTNSSISFQVRNGTYSYFVPSGKGINCSTSNGTFTVNGRNVYIPLRFIALIQFTILETGLPSAPTGVSKSRGNITFIRPH